MKSDKKLFYWEKEQDEISNTINVKDERKLKLKKSFLPCNHGNILEWNTDPSKRVEVKNLEIERKNKRDPNYSYDPKIII